jgi:hypothetical protein
MSGPIIRKYGFPNFEKIFGERAPQHGIDDVPTPGGAPGAGTPTEPAAPTTPEPNPEAPVAKATESKGKG